MSDAEESDAEVEIISQDEPDEEYEDRQTDEDDNNKQPQPGTHPWPYIQDMFTFVGEKGKSWRLHCVLCKPKVKELLAYKNSPSNLKKHIERVHPHHMEKYMRLTTAKRKMTDTAQGPAPAKQLKLFETKKVTQKSVDGVIINFLVHGTHALNVVEQPEFKAMINHLQPEVTVISRGTAKNRIEKATQDMKKDLKAAMSKVDSIATTTDCWTASRRGFLGVTAHWIQPDTMTRCSAALACKQIEGRHTFSVLAEGLNEIHTEFNIREKIVRTTTDSGSNFIKAFRVYGTNDDDENNNNRAELLQAEEFPVEIGEGSDDEEDPGEPVETVDVEELFDQDDGLDQYQLPKHHKCACHLLNLVATTDVSKANESPTYRKISRSSFAKCQALWNKSSRSTTAAEIIQKHCKLQLVRPIDTRWNSLFYSVERILRIIKERGEGAITAVCNALKLPMLTPAEVLFLGEYARSMSPVAKAVDVLQGDVKVQMGWLVPVITILKNKLQKLSVSKYKYCGPLLDALQEGLDTRFGQILRDPELIAAAILVPKFKTHWTNDGGVLKRGLDYIKHHLKEPTPEDTLASPQSSVDDDDDFFSCVKKGNTHDATTRQLENYLASPGDDTMVSLKSFPAVCHLSIKLNTPLPASAACERLFSTAGQIFRPRRARISSKNFENQLLLKLNKTFW